MSFLSPIPISETCGLRQAAPGGQDWGTIADLFWSLFELVPAITPALAEEAHRIRFEIYCRDREWEPENPQWPGLEFDAFDGRARHVLLRYRPEDRFVGAMRAVEPEPAACHTSFPMQELTDDRRLHDRASVMSMVEASRFCLARARLMDLCAGGDGAADLRTVNPFLMVGLMVAVIQTPLELGYGHVCAVLEPWLARRLGRFGLMVELIGEPVEHHGLRQPCLIPVEANVARPTLADNAFLQFFARSRPLWTAAATKVPAGERSARQAAA
ncbi:MAG: PEP-CTERM/exosortase system-associated acyltransferase [Sphingomonadales bacterium]|nr:PEP-CTERM/exosortase system-associated acyltransferase [Sphingomonadales bacterium]